MSALLVQATPRHRLRHLPGRLLDFLLRRQKRAAGLAEVHGHHVYATALGPGAVAIDAGAHTGAFSGALIDRFGCRCHSLEPVPQLYARIAEGPLRRRHLLALCDHEGSVVLHLAANPEANSLDPALAAESERRGTLTARAATLASFLQEADLAGADLLKLDIEGAELAVLEGASDETLASLGQITVEFHDFLAAARERGDRERIAALRHRLAGLGFGCLVLSWPASNHSDTLFLNLRRHRLTLWQRLSWATLGHGTLTLRRLLHRAGARLAARQR